MRSCVRRTDGDSYSPPKCVERATPSLSLPASLNSSAPTSFAITPSAAQIGKNENEFQCSACADTQAHLWGATAPCNRVYDARVVTPHPSPQFFHNAAPFQSSLARFDPEWCPTIGAPVAGALHANGTS